MVRVRKSKNMKYRTKLFRDSVCIPVKWKDDEILRVLPKEVCFRYEDVEKLENVNRNMKQLLDDLIKNGIDNPTLHGLVILFDSLENGNTPVNQYYRIQYGKDFVDTIMNLLNCPETSTSYEYNITPISSSSSQYSTPMSSSSSQYSTPMSSPISDESPSTPRIFTQAEGFNPKGLFDSFNQACKSGKCYTPVQVQQQLNILEKNLLYLTSISENYRQTNIPVCKISEVTEFNEIRYTKGDIPKLEQILKNLFSVYIIIIQDGCQDDKVKILLEDNSQISNELSQTLLQTTGLQNLFGANQNCQSVPYITQYQTKDICQYYDLKEDDTESYYIQDNFTCLNDNYGSILVNLIRVLANNEYVKQSRGRTGNYEQIRFNPELNNFLEYRNQNPRYIDKIFNPKLQEFLRLSISELERMNILVPEYGNGFLTFQIREPNPQSGVRQPSNYFQRFKRLFGRK